MPALVLIAVAGLLAQLVDGGIGMGFGVVSTTCLVSLAGLGAAQASAVVHTAKIGTAVVSGAAHWKFGNVDWRIALGLGVPGAIGAFAGSTILSTIPMRQATPVTAAILAAIGAVLVWRFGNAGAKRPVDAAPYRRGQLSAIGLVGGFVDATGGGGWGPVTMSSLLVAGRTSPRRVVGTVNTAEFLVSVAATLGFVMGLWREMTQHAAAAAALLVGGAIAAPFAAWLVAKVNPTLLGGLVGTALVVLNLPKVMKLLGVAGGSAPVVALQVLLALVGVAWAVRGYLAVRAANAGAGGVRVVEATHGGGSGGGAPAGVSGQVPGAETTEEATPVGAGFGSRSAA